MIETAKRLRRSGGARSSDRRGGRRPRAGLAPSEWWSPAGRSARRWRPLVLAVLRGTLLAERVGRARNVRQLHDRLVGILDRLRFFELVTWPVSTGRRSGCCRSAAVRSARRAGQSPPGCRSREARGCRPCCSRTFGRARRRPRPEPPGRRRQPTSVGRRTSRARAETRHRGGERVSPFSECIPPATPPRTSGRKRLDRRAPAEPLDVQDDGL
jgi:hypothetical protein